MGLQLFATLIGLLEGQIEAQAGNPGLETFLAQSRKLRSWLTYCPVASYMLRQSSACSKA